MQEPGDLRGLGTNFNMVDFFPVGYVIEQERVAPHRVKVRIPAKHRDIKDADLPYFRVAMGIGGNGLNGKSGKHVTLAHGTEVIVMLYDKMGYNGFVIFQTANKSTDTHPEGELYGYRDEVGNSFSVNEDGTMVMKDSAGASVSMGAGVIDIKAETFNLHVGDMHLTGDTLIAMLTTISQTATDFSISAVNPIITDGSGGGGGAFDGPSLNPLALPVGADLHNKTDL